MVSRDTIHAILALIVGMGMIAIAGGMDYEDAMVEQERYCQNVELWYSNPEIPEANRPGHPDFRENYQAVCR